MSKFCKSCGNELPDDASFCGSCGSMCEAAAPAEPVGYAPAPEGTEGYGYPMPENKNKKPIIIGAIAGGVVLVVVLLILLLSGGGPESALDNMVDYSQGDFDVLEDLAPEQYWDYYEEKKGESVDELIEKTEKQYEAYAEMMAEVDYDYEVLEEEELSESQIRAINEYLVEEYGFEKDSVSEGCELKYEITASTGGKSNTETETGTFLEIDGDWYIVNVDFEGDEVDYISFNNG